MAARLQEIGARSGWGCSTAAAWILLSMLYILLHGLHVYFFVFLLERTP